MEHTSRVFVRQELKFLFVFLLAALFFAGASVWGTTIGTNVSTADLYATSTVQATGNVIAYADIGIGTTTPIEDLSIVGDIFLTGGIGINNATSSAGDLAIGTDFFFYNNGALGVASSTPGLNGASVSVAGSLYIDTGGLGIGNATTTDGNLAIGTDFFFYSNGALGVASSTPGLSGASISVDGSVYIDTGGLGVGNATTTDGNVEVAGRTITSKLAVGTGTGNVLARLVHGKCTVDPPALDTLGSTGTGVGEDDIGHAACTNATGVTASDRVLVGVEGGGAWLTDVVIVSASSTDTDTINFVFKNTSTTTASDIASGAHIYYFGTQ